MARRVFTIYPESEKALAVIRANHPELESDAAAVRYALAYTVTDSKRVSNDEEVAQLATRLAAMGREQSINTVLLVSLVQSLQTSVADDALDDGHIQQARTVVKKWIERAQRDRRHGGDDYGSDH